jgi:hypothetical protein
MGFLDSSSNNILLDAVLTDVGRQFLARNDGSFSIHKFALSDDEVNYGIIRKYGRSVGKEKIEKNTPVFEALTGGSQAQKYRLVTVSNQFLIKLPSLQLSNVAGSNVVALGFGTSASRSSAVTISQKIIDDVEIPVDLVDSTFTVEVSNLFLQILGHRPENIDSLQRATYVLNGTSETTQKGAQLQFTLALKSITDALFSVYGSTLNKSQIITYVRVTGLVSGAVSEFSVTITK